MRFSIITPNRNGAKYLRDSIDSIQQQKNSGVDVEHIVIDGLSDDGSEEIITSYGGAIDKFLSERDTGPANAINKGLALASGEVVAWLGADDRYEPEALARVAATMHQDPNSSFCFGGCRIIDESGKEIRKGITRFKELFFPVSSKFTFQCINYISQPSVFIRRDAWLEAGPLKEDMIAAWDYELFLRLWRIGNGVRVSGKPLSAFRWHKGSISGQLFRIQFKEEFYEARKDAGNFTVQTLLHFFVWWGIIGAYSLLTRKQEKKGDVKRDLP